MAQDTATIARTVYEAFNDRDFDRGLALMADDAEWVNIPTDDPFRGAEGFRRNYEQWANAFPDGRCENIEIHAGDDWPVSSSLGEGRTRDR